MAKTKATSTAFTYVGEDARTYEERSLVVSPGDTVDWPDGPPDYRWEPATNAAPTSDAPEADATPLED